MILPSPGTSQPGNAVMRLWTACSAFPAGRAAQTGSAAPSAGGRLSRHAGSGWHGVHAICSLPLELLCCNRSVNKPLASDHQVCHLLRSVGASPGETRPIAAPCVYCWDDRRRLLQFNSSGALAVRSPTWPACRPPVPVGLLTYAACLGCRSIGFCSTVRGQREEAAQCVMSVGL